MLMSRYLTVQDRDLSWEMYKATPSPLSLVRLHLMVEMPQLRQIPQSATSMRTKILQALFRDGQRQMQDDA